MVKCCRTCKHFYHPECVNDSVTEVVYIYEQHLEHLFDMGDITCAVEEIHSDLPEDVLVSIAETIDMFLKNRLMEQVRFEPKNYDEFYCRYYE